MNDTPARPLFLWVTRSAPFNHETAEHLQAAGHNPLKLPVLHTRPLEHDRVSADVDALVFTSPNGVRHHRFCESLAGTPVFAVGDRTAKLARDAGYANVTSAGGDVVDLYDLIRTRLVPPARIVHLSAAAPAGDLVGQLRQVGFDAERRSVYESVDTEFDQLRPALAALPWVDGVIIHSPRAGKRVASFLADLSGRWNGAAYCISEAAAAPLKRLGGVRTEVARRPNDRALRDLVVATTNEDQDKDPSDKTSTPGQGVVVPFRRPNLPPAPHPDDPTPPSAA